MTHFLRVDFFFAVDFFVDFTVFFVVARFFEGLIALNVRLSTSHASTFRS